MNSKDFIEQVKVKHGLPSNYAAARFLGMTDQRISAYARGRREFDDETAKKVAEALDLEPIYVMLQVQAERAPQHEIKVIWRQAAEAMLTAAKKGHATGLALLAIIGLSSFPGTDARADAVLSDQFSGDDIYIMRIWMFVQALARRCYSGFPSFWNASTLRSVTA